MDSHHNTPLYRLTGILTNTAAAHEGRPFYIQGIKECCNFISQSITLFASTAIHVFLCFFQNHYNYGFRYTLLISIYIYTALLILLRFSNSSCGCSILPHAFLPSSTNILATIGELHKLFYSVTFFLLQNFVFTLIFRSNFFHSTVVNRSLYVYMYIFAFSFTAGTICTTGPAYTMFMLSAVYFSILLTLIY